MVRRSLSILFWAIFFFLLIAFFGGVQLFASWRAQPVTATLESASFSGPRDVVIIDFSRAMREGSLEGKVTLAPAMPFRVEWQDAGKRLILSPDANWPLDMTYRLTIGSGQTVLFNRTPAFSFVVRSPALPQVVSVTPADGAKDVLLGVEDPIQVAFDRSVSDFYVDFQFDPPLEAVYQNDPEKTVFEILPKVALEAGRTYAMTIQVRYRDEGEEEYQPIQRISFSTLPPQPKERSSDFGTRIEEAKRYTQAKHREGKYIDVNLTNQVMTLFEDGRSIDAYIISSGKPGMDTPTGNFFIENQAARPWSKQYGLYMPYWQAITPDGKYGIHELPEWPSGYKEGANHLGIPVSHGCMRLGVGPAKRLFEWADIGTPVVIY